jgi:hypothetical protein
MNRSQDGPLSINCSRLGGRPCIVAAPSVRREAIEPLSDKEPRREESRLCEMIIAGQRKRRNGRARALVALAFEKGSRLCEHEFFYAVLRGAAPRASATWTAGAHARRNSR